MDMSGEQHIAAPRDAVWNALNDPEILGQCIPGCESIEKTSETEFEAAVTAKIGPVKAKFKGAVELQDLDPPNSYTIVGEGKGGAAGFGKSSAKVRLEEADGGTRMIYEVNAQVGGKLAQIGSRLVSSASKKMADDFFEKFKAVVEAGAAQASAPGAAATAPQTAAAPAPSTPAEGHQVEEHQAETHQAGADGGHAAAAAGPATAKPAATGLPMWAWAVIVAVAVIVVVYLLSAGH